MESATGRIPVEIWHKILALSVRSRPLLPQVEDGFIENLQPFSDHCTTISTYHAERDIISRLRLVCKSWNQFLAQYVVNFVVLPLHWHEGIPISSQSQIRVSKHIQVVNDFDCNCLEPCRYSRTYLRQKKLGRRSGFRDGIKRALADCNELNAQVLVTDNSSILDMEEPVSLDRVRALSVILNHHEHRWNFNIPDRFPNLTHLELKAVLPRTFAQGLSLPQLTTLSIHVRYSFTDPWPVLGGWDLPEIKYLTINGLFQPEFDRGICQTLLESIGEKLKGLSIAQDFHPLISPRGYNFPEDLWTWCPNLEIIGSSAESILRIPPPPKTVPLETVFIMALFAKDRLLDETRNHVRETADVTGACSRWHFTHFRIPITWNRLVLNLQASSMSRRAEWINFLVPFGLLSKRHDKALLDLDGIAFDGDKALEVRQYLNVEALMLSERIETTSWTRWMFRRRE
ncbi:hypothetical protein CPB86DRAFT_810235 [Serendipita vermifera]|nr:hypothetical protein CPB86DRAFT_810235 [Serendipita vermifera]